MPQFKNAMEVFKLLDKSNCQECYVATCLAFSAGALASYCAMISSGRWVHSSSRFCPLKTAAANARQVAK